MQALYIPHLLDMYKCQHPLKLDGQLQVMVCLENLVNIVRKYETLTMSRQLTFVCGGIYYYMKSKLEAWLSKIQEELCHNDVVHYYA